MLEIGRDPTMWMWCNILSLYLTLWLQSLFIIIVFFFNHSSIPACMFSGHFVLYRGRLLRLIRTGIRQQSHDRLWLVFIPASATCPSTSRNWYSSRLLVPMVACQASRRLVSAHLIGSQALWLQLHCQNKWSSEQMAFLFLDQSYSICDQRGCATVPNRLRKWAFSHRFPAIQTSSTIYKSRRPSIYGLACYADLLWLCY